MSSGGSATPDALSRLENGDGEYGEFGTLAGTKVIKYNYSTNSKLPRIAGNSDAYIVVNENNEIKQIGIYKDHKLVREIGFEKAEIGIHAHDWIEKQTPKGIQIVRKNKGHDHLTDDEKNMVNDIIKEVINGHGYFKVDKRLVSGKRGKFY